MNMKSIHKKKSYKPQMKNKNKINVILPTGS